jgi:hypothetical protein
LAEHHTIHLTTTTKKNYSNGFTKNDASSPIPKQNPMYLKVNGPFGNANGEGQDSKVKQTRQYGEKTVYEAR